MYPPVDGLVIVSHAENDDAPPTQQHQTLYIAGVEVLILVDDEELQAAEVEVRVAAERSIQEIGYLARLCVGEDVPVELPLSFEVRPSSGSLRLRPQHP